MPKPRAIIAQRIAQSLVVLNVIMLLIRVVLTLVFSGEPFTLSDFLANTFRSLGGIVYNIIALLIILRHPRHMIGWLFLVVGLSDALGSLGGGLQALVSPGSVGTIYDLGLWLGHLVWIPALLVPLTLVLQFFPDGRLPSRRWWPVPAVTLMGLLGYASSIAFYPWPWEAQGILDTHNPFGIAGGEAFFTRLADVSAFPLGFGFLGTVVILIVRFRRARGRERAQMKWLVYTAVICIILLFVFDDGPINDLLFPLLPSFLALAMGIAILRHRLFDIDIIIRRTVQYAAVSAVLIAVYYGSVLLLQTFFSNAVGEPSPLIIVLSTLFAAALFNPLRRRLQTSVDRRFFRNKYDAQQVLDRFAQTARDEVELDTLTATLAQVIQDTMHPEHINVWITNEPTGEN